jgi:tetratricopeptide (TPR) repeat protein
VEQSLVVAEPNEEGDELRYRMLEPVRQYALEKLEEGGEAEEVQRRHSAHYLALAEEAEPRIRGRDQVAWLDRLEAENDNLRAAIGWSLEAGEAQTAARFGWALSMYWAMRARHGEGRLLMEGTLARGGADLPAQMRARALWALAVCMYGSGDDERLMAISEEGAALFRHAGDRHGEAYMLMMSGFAALQLGDFDRTALVLEEALRLFRQHEDAWGSAHVLTHLAVIPLKLGDHVRATGYAEEALAHARQTGDRYAANISLSLLAQAALAAGEPGRAAPYFREALTVAHEMRDAVHVARCMQGLAAVDGERGAEPLRAARLLGAAEALLEAAGAPSYAYGDRGLDRLSAPAVRERLGQRAWAAARGEGRAMTFEQAVEYALEDDEASPA